MKELQPYYCIHIKKVCIPHKCSGLEADDLKREMREYKLKVKEAIEKRKKALIKIGLKQSHSMMVLEQLEIDLGFAL